MGFKTTEMRWDVETARAYMRSTWFSAAGSLLVGFVSGCCAAPGLSGALPGGMAVLGYGLQFLAVVLLLGGLFSGFNALIRVIQMPEAQSLMVGKGERAGAGVVAFMGFCWCGLSLVTQLGLFFWMAASSSGADTAVPT